VAILVLLGQLVEQQCLLAQEQLEEAVVSTVAIVVLQETLVLLEVLEVEVLLDLEANMDRDLEMVALEEH
jgi:hypothetical protein